MYAGCHQWVARHPKKENFMKTLFRATTATLGSTINGVHVGHVAGKVTGERITAD